MLRILHGKSVILVPLKISIIHDADAYRSVKIYFQVQNHGKYYQYKIFKKSIIQTLVKLLYIITIIIVVIILGFDNVLSSLGLSLKFLIPL